MKHKFNLLLLVLFVTVRLNGQINPYQRTTPAVKPNTVGIYPNIHKKESWNGREPGSYSLKFRCKAFKPGQMAGENNVQAKLTGEKVIEIRKRGATAGYGDWPSLAEEYGVQYQTLYKIMKGKLWNKPEFFPPQE